MKTKSDHELSTETATQLFRTIETLTREHGSIDLTPYIAALFHATSYLMTTVGPAQRKRIKELTYFLNSTVEQTKELH